MALIGPPMFPGSRETESKQYRQSSAIVTNHLTPEFLVEIHSTERLCRTQAKMEEYMANGCQLGWLIDQQNKTDHIYRRGQTPEPHHDIRELAGEGPVAGFVLDVSEIFS